jgi:hypothetical protein
MVGTCGVAADNQTSTRNSSRYKYKALAFWGGRGERILSYHGTGPGRGIGKIY